MYTEFEDTCDFCKVDLNTFNHLEYCPHELMAFLKTHVCSGSSADFQVCFPCADYVRDSWEDGRAYTHTKMNWDDDSLHTEFCRSFRQFLKDKTNKTENKIEPETLPQIQKRPESET